MSLPNELLPVGLLGSTSAAGGGEYTIERSVRFNSSDSAYLSRVNSTAGSLTTWTWSGWVKLSYLDDTYPCLFGGGTSGNRFFVRYEKSPGTWEIYTDPPNGGSVERHSTVAAFRDYSAWAHYVLIWDTSNATASDRCRFYVNGILQQLDGTFSQNIQSSVNNNSEQQIGKEPGYGRYFDGYLADIHFIDGQALDPTSFGEFDDNGIWQPIAYSGSYGTNGFHLPFFDNSTAAALGTDTSGNGNTWTVNNITAVAPSYGSPTNANTPAYEISIGPTNPLSGTYVWSNAFDANGSTIGLIGPITFNGTKPTWSTSAGVEVMAAGNGITAAVNGGTQIACTNGGWTTISSGSSGTLNSIWVYSSTGASYFYGVRVDGVDISVKALLGSASDTDSLVDVPTNGTETDTGLGGEVRGNYATLNPLDNGGLTLSNGNLQFDRAANAWFSCRSTIAVTSGKWYWEVSLTTGVQCMVGIAKATATIGSYFSGGSDGWGYNAADGLIYNNNVTQTYGNTWTAGDTIGIAFDADTGELKFYKNGTVQNSGTAAYTGLTSGPYFAAIGLYGTATAHINFGQRPFAYTAPSGFKALCTANLPAPVVTKPSEYMDVVTYTGNGGTQGVSGLEFSPDLVWIKDRTNTYFHRLFDTVRGATKGIFTNSTNAESTLLNDLTQFNADGFSLGSGLGVNVASAAHVTWTWDAGSSTVTNTDGSITSSVRANPSAGFSIVGYTGTSASATVGHGLGVRPVFMIIKNRSTSGNWTVLSDWTYPGGSVAQSWNNRRLKLNTTNAYDGTSAWNNATIPTSSVFYLGKPPDVNGSGNSMVAYCFAPVDGYSAFGSYTGNGSADGTFVFTNHRPRWILLKRTDTTSNWTIIDTAREGYNVDNDPLYPNLNNAEGTTDLADILSNGFKLRSADASVNANAGTYIYASFAESPFQYSRAR